MARSSRHKKQPDQGDHTDNRDSGRNLSDCHGSHEQRRQHGDSKRTPATAAASHKFDVATSVVGASATDGFVAPHRDGDRRIGHSRALVGACTRLG